MSAKAEGRDFPLYIQGATDRPYKNDTPTCVMCGSSDVSFNTTHGESEFIGGRQYQVELWGCRACGWRETVVLSYVEPTGEDA